MATRTVSQTGPLSDSATFGGSAFSNGDDIVNDAGNGFTLTIDQNATVAGFSGTGGNGTTVVNSGVTLTLTGNVVQGNAAFTLGSGTGDAHLVFDCTAADRKFLFGDVSSSSAYLDCFLVVLGTSAAHCTISKAGANYCWFDDFGENDGTGSNKVGYNCTYCDFTGIGNSTGAYSLAISSLRRDTLLDHCTFDGCGAVFTARPYSGDNFGGKTFQITDCRWSNSTGDYSLNLHYDGQYAATVGIKRNSFDQSLLLNLTAINVEGNYFVQGHSILGGTMASYTRNLYRTSGSPECNVTCDTSNNYWLAALDHPGNPHCITGFNANSTHTDWIFENPNAQAIDSGECFYSGVGGLTLRFNLAIPGEEDGLAIGNMAHHGTTATGDPWIVEHCTVVGSNNCYITFTESAVGTPPLYGSVKSNLAADLVGSSAVIFYDLGRADGLRVDYTDPAENDYNGLFGQDSFTDVNNSTVYQGYKANFSTTPGANNIIANPEFVDPSRSFANWAVYKGAAGSGDSLATRTAAAHALVFDDPTLIADDLIPWVRGGFAPTNPVYTNAGHDSATIGAVEAPEPAISTVAMLGSVIAGCL